MPIRLGTLNQEVKKEMVDIYDCMSLKDICNMPVKEIADKDCVLLMWVTELMKKAFKVIDVLYL